MIILLIINYLLLNDKKEQNSIFLSNYSSYEHALIASVFMN